MNKKIALLAISMLLLSSLSWAESDPIKLEVNNEEIIFDLDPIIIKDRALVPLRPIFEALDLKVSWDRENQSISGENQDYLIKLEIDSPKGQINDKLVELEIPPMILKERTMLPVRFIGEALGAKVDWNPETRSISITKPSSKEEYLTKLSYSNLLDEASQKEVREAMEKSGIPQENIDFFFEELSYYNKTVEGRSLVEKGFKTIDGLQVDYDLVSMIDLWDAKNPLFIGYNCRILSYDLMKDSINIGNIDTSNSDWMVFDKYALANNPKDIFSEKELEEFKTLYSFVPTKASKDIFLHLENVKKDWAKKEISFSNQDKRSLISVFFHDEDGYLFIGHMGLLLPSQDEKLLFIEKLSFQEPYQAIKFNNRLELNDYLMNKYDISWNQPTARPFIMENDELLETYRPNPNNPKNTN